MRILDKGTGDMYMSRRRRFFCFCLEALPRVFFVFVYSATQLDAKRPRAVISLLSEWCETQSRTPSEAISPAKLD